MDWLSVPFLAEGTRRLWGRKAFEDASLILDGDVRPAAVVAAIARTVSRSTDSILEAFGGFVVFSQLEGKKGCVPLPAACSVPLAMQALNDLLLVSLLPYGAVGNAQGEGAVPPATWEVACERITDTGLDLRTSARLWPLAPLLKGAALALCTTCCRCSSATAQLLLPQPGVGAGQLPPVLRLAFSSGAAEAPHRDAPRGLPQHGAAAPQAAAVPGLFAALVDMCPNMVALDSSMRVLAVGPALLAAAPALQPGADAAQVLRIAHPPGLPLERSAVLGLAPGAHVHLVPLAAAADNPAGADASACAAAHLQQLRGTFRVIADGRTGDTESHPDALLFCGSELIVSCLARTAQPAISRLNGIRKLPRSASASELASFGPRHLQRVGSAGHLQGSLQGMAEAVRKQRRQQSAPPKPPVALVRQPVSRGLPADLCGGDWLAWFEILSMLPPAVDTRLAELREALGASEMMDLQVIAHAFKGVAETCCAAGLTEACFQLEEFAAAVTYYEGSGAPDDEAEETDLMRAHFESASARFLPVIEQRAALVVDSVRLLEAMSERDRAVRLAGVDGFIELVTEQSAGHASSEVGVVARAPAAADAADVPRGARRSVQWPKSMPGGLGVRAAEGCCLPPASKDDEAAERPLLWPAIAPAAPGPPPALGTLLVAIGATTASALGSATSASSNDEDDAFQIFDVGYTPAAPSAPGDVRSGRSSATWQKLATAKEATVQRKETGKILSTGTPWHDDAVSETSSSFESDSAPPSMPSRLAFQSASDNNLLDAYKSRLTSSLSPYHACVPRDSHRQLSESRELEGTLGRLTARATAGLCSGGRLSVGKKTVMLVDDNPIVIEILKRGLREEGFAIVSRASAEQALKYLKRPSSALPDVLLVDVFYKPAQMSGLQMTRELRASGISPVILPVIFMSSHTHKDLVEAAYEAGGNDWMCKPINMHETRTLELVNAEAEARLLRHFLPKAVIRKLKQEGGRLPFSEHVPEATFLFADVVGFTTLCGAVDPTMVVRMLHRLVSALDEATGRHGVFKVDTVGDCYICSTGCALTEEGEPLVAPARRMLGFAEELLRITESMPPIKGWDEPIRMRVGMHTGPVIAAAMGVISYKFTFIGDTMNTAARMESHGIPGCVHLSAPCFDALVSEGAAAEDFVPLRGMEVKGKGRMQTYIAKAGDEWPAAAAAAAELPPPSPV